MWQRRVVENVSFQWNLPSAANPIDFSLVFRWFRGRPSRSKLERFLFLSFLETDVFYDWGRSAGAQSSSDHDAAERGDGHGHRLVRLRRTRLAQRPGDHLWNDASSFFFIFNRILLSSIGPLVWPPSVGRKKQLLISQTRTDSKKKAQV